jgi:hypothetical protein
MTQGWNPAHRRRRGFGVAAVFRCARRAPVGLGMVTGVKVPFYDDVLRARMLRAFAISLVIHCRWNLHVNEGSCCTDASGNGHIVKAGLLADGSHFIPVSLIGQVARPIGQTATRPFIASRDRHHGAGRPSCCMSHVMAGRDLPLLTRPLSGAMLQVEPTIQPQIVIPLTYSASMKSGMYCW